MDVPLLLSVLEQNLDALIIMTCPHHELSKHLKSFQSDRSICASVLPDANPAFVDEEELLVQAEIWADTAAASLQFVPKKQRLLCATPWFARVCQGLGTAAGCL